MLASPSPPPPPPSARHPPPTQWKYDVFVSFRGMDVRNNFISHVFSAFSQASIDYFRDDAREDIGEELGSKLFKAIWHSRIALIVFSSNYANSKWCMNELVEILECRKRLENHGHLVVPVFLDVNTRDLTSRSKFAQGFERLCGQVRDEGQIQKWSYALAQIKHLSGFDLRNHAGENKRRLLDIVVEYLVEKISEIRQLHFVRNAIGGDLLVGEVISLIRKGQEEDVRVIGICGVGGIGKTMVAAVVCERIRRDFDCFVFLDKIGEADRFDILDLQTKLLLNLMKVEGLRTSSDIQTNIKEINSNMRFKRILLVLDNVTSKEQIDYFWAGDRELLCPGSRILITTRDQNLLKDLKVDDKYIVKGLDPNEALRLFCRQAWKREEPQEGYEELFRNLAHYAGGHPLSLKRLGSFLNGKPKHKWHQTLEKLVRSPYLNSLIHSFDSVGPYGGQGGDAFDDGTHNGVRQIRLYGQSIIESMTIDYDQNGCLVRSHQHGRHVHDIERLVSLDHPIEYLISISGHIDDFEGREVVWSLKFHSNKKTYGPYGSERGRAFHLSHSDDEQIIGFHGKCSSHLNSIGAHFGPISHKYPFDVVGPFGGDSGTGWDDGKHMDVRQITIGFDSAVESISILYDEHGRPVGPFTHGTSEGGKTYTIELNPSEYLKSISGYINKDSGRTILQSLTIHTSERDHGPIGIANKGRHFSFPYTGGKIVGFHGSCNGPHLESIGAFYEPIAHTYPDKVYGPFGGVGEKSWDFVDIKGINVHYADFIESITFEVNEATSTEPETNYGGNGRENTFKVKLRDREYISYFAGYLKTANDSGTLISSLTFQTNERLLGPIGREEGLYFSLPSKEAGKVIRIFGRSSDYLESIGAQVKPCYPLKRVGLLRSQSASKWDDQCTHANVRKITVEHKSKRKRSVQSIKIQYEDENNKLLHSETYDGSNAKKNFKLRKKTTQTIEIREPDGHSTSISGCTCQPDRETIRGTMSSTSYQWEHAVFVSFSGSDVRNTFISHLFERLERKKILYFYDKDRRYAGMNIEDKIFGAIHHARIAIAVFSANFAHSKWCMNELVEILNCRRDRRHFVFIPIFYNRLAEVKTLRESKFEQALEKFHGKERDNKQRDWKAAIAEATEIHGFELENDAHGDEAALIDLIVDRIVKEVRPLDSVENAIPRPHHVKVCRPSGGEGEKSWDFAGIKGIDVHHADYTESITFEDDEASSSEPHMAGEFFQG